MKRHAARLSIVLCALYVLGCVPSTGPDGGGTAVMGVLLDASSKAIPVGATAQLTATVSPSEADNPGVAWTSSAEAVATVSADGLVTAVSAGSAVITVTTAEGGFAAACDVTVYTHGGLDLSFGGHGLASVANAQANAVAVQPDGRIVAAGMADGATQSDFLLARFSATDGSLDASFGSGGLVKTDRGGGTEGSEYLFAVAVQADGKIVAMGLSDADLCILRYTSAGALDSGFGSGGVVTVALPEGATPSDIDWGLALKADGKIIISGGLFDGDNYQFVVGCYTSAGAPDASFGDGGFSLINVADDDDTATAVAVTPTGIVAGGRAKPSPAAMNFGLACFDVSGNVDAGYGTAGAVNANISGEMDCLTALAVQADGKAIAVGYSVGVSTSKVLLARFTAAGALDPTFGSGGKVVQDITVGAGAQDVAIQADGKIVVVGDAGDIDALVARYTTAGTLDAGFGSGGMLLTHADGMRDAACAVAIQADGKLVVAGTSWSDASSTWTLAVTRYWP
jgi:uncharacterized delta-60 repeat protein